MADKSSASGNVWDNNEEWEHTLFEPEQYEKHKSLIAVLMGRYMLRHLLFLYQEFEKDLLLPIVLGEIAHHNVRKIYTQKGTCLEVRGDIPTGRERLKYYEPTNAFSISEATGIPRETVRRKIDKLVQKGWVAKGTKGEVTMSNAVSEYFTAGLNKKILSELLITSSCITDLMNKD